MKLQMAGHIMTKLTLPILFLISVFACTPSQRFEASTNLDLSDIRPFLQELDNELDLGIEHGQLATFTDTVAIGEQSSRNLNITYGGRRRSVEYVVFMDDYASPDLYFFTAYEPLASAIQAFMVDYSERH